MEQGYGGRETHGRQQDQSLEGLRAVRGSWRAAALPRQQPASILAAELCDPQETQAQPPWQGHTYLLRAADEGKNAVQALLFFLVDS